MKPPASCFAHLLRLLGRRGWSRDDAEDLIQDALLRLTEYCRAAEVRNETAFLARTAINLSIDRHRRESRYASCELSLEQLTDAVPLIDTSPDPDEVFAAKQRLSKVRQTLDAVSVRTREIYLAHRAGYSHRELAHAFGVSTSTIEKSIARAVVALMDMKDAE